MPPTTPPDQPAKLINVEHSRQKAAAISDPCVPLVPDTEGGWTAFEGDLSVAAQRAGWHAGAKQQAFTLGLVRRMIGFAGQAFLLPTVTPGDPSADLQWGTWRAILSSFGYGAWSELATAMLAVAPSCPFVPSDTADAWYEGAIDAHRTSGVPLSFGRIPWRDWLRGAAAGFDARYLRHVAAWHIVRHAFLSADATRLCLFYRSAGTSLTIIDPTGPIPALMLGTLRAALQLPDQGSKKDPNPLGQATTGVLQRLTPRDLYRQRRPIALDPHVMPGPGAQLIGYQADHPYFEHGCALDGVAVCIDGAPRLIDYDQQEPEDVLGWEWLRSIDAKTHARHRAWSSALPTTAPDGRPSQLLRAAFPNLSFVNEDHACVVDAILVCDLIRRRDPSVLLDREFPLLAILPNTPTIEGSTNTGKTALVDSIAKAFDSRANARTIADSSAPTKRAIAADIETHGFAALDEWKVPAENSDHLLRWNGVQTLCTGGEIECGKAYSNESHAIKLASPIVLNAKYLPMPEDMLSRTVFMWVDPRGDDEGPEVAQRWNSIVTGRLSLDLRLAALRMLDQWPDIDQLGGIAPSQRQWRMVGHRVCAARICAEINGIPLSDALARIDAVMVTQAQTHQQLTQAAIDSGLVARYENPSTITLDLGAIFEAVEPNVDPKHRADQLITLARLAHDHTATRGKVGAFSPGGLVKAFLDYLRTRKPLSFASKSTSEIFAYLLGAKFQGATDKDVAIRMREALVGACTGPHGRWPLPGLFGIDGWYVERVPAADGHKLFKIDRITPNP